MRNTSNRLKDKNRCQLTYNDKNIILLKREGCTTLILATSFACRVSQNKEIRKEEMGNRPSLLQNIALQVGLWVIK